MEMGALLRSQREFFATGATRDVDYRLAALGLLKDALNRREGALMDALGRDLNKAPMETYMTDLQQKGYIRADMEIRTLASALFGMIGFTVLRKQFRKEPLNTDAVRETLRTMLAGILDKRS